MSLTQQAHQIILDNLTAQSLKQARYAIDATCGNGHDTLFLAQNSEYVFAFDVQEQAIQQTLKKLEKANVDDLGKRVTLLQKSHDQIQTLIEAKNPTIKQRVDVVTFNLGYLPRSDKSITTKASSTIPALEQSIKLLDPKGIITLICYRGHGGGASEAQQVFDWLDNQVENNKLNYRIVDSENATDTTPVLVVINLVE